MVSAFLLENFSWHKLTSKLLLTFLWFGIIHCKKICMLMSSLYVNLLICNTYRNLAVVDDLVISAISSGIVAWIGFGAQDSTNDINYMVNTLLTTRFFHSDRNAHRWTRNVMDCGYEVLILSQISLYSTMYMDKPYFYQAMNARRSKPFYERLIGALRRRYKPDKIREARFGAAYTVTTTTRGPIFVVESHDQPQNVFTGPVGPPPPYPYPQPPMYGAPPRQYLPQPAPYPVQHHAPRRPRTRNMTYEALPPLRPLQPYPDYNYPVY